jgi:hypothetical protein
MPLIVVPLGEEADEDGGGGDDGGDAPTTPPSALGTRWRSTQSHSTLTTRSILAKHYSKFQEPAKRAYGRTRVSEGFDLIESSRAWNKY